MTRIRHVKLLAAVTIVLVTLSGFSPNRSSGGKGGGGSKSHTTGGSGGGGCSSKKSSSHSGSSDSGFDDGYRRGSRSNTSNGTGSSGRSSSGPSTATGKLVECAAKIQNTPSATIRVRNAGSRKGTYTVAVDFRDARGSLVDTGTTVASLGGNTTKRVRVPMGDPSLVNQVRTCELNSIR